MQTTGLSLFSNCNITIEYTWLTAAERAQFIRLFTQHQTIFSTMETFVGNRFLLKCPKASDAELLPPRVRQTLVRDAIMYIDRFSASLRPLLLIVLQKLLLSSPPMPVLYNAEYALQRRLPMTELLVHSI
jgi:hypothetical protein